MAAPSGGQSTASENVAAPSASKSDRDAEVDSISSAMQHLTFPTERQTEATPQHEGAMPFASNPQSATTGESIPNYEALYLASQANLIATQSALKATQTALGATQGELNAMQGVQMNPYDAFTAGFLAVEDVSDPKSSLSKAASRVKTRGLNFMDWPNFAESFAEFAERAKSVLMARPNVKYVKDLLPSTIVVAKNEKRLEIGLEIFFDLLNAGQDEHKTFLHEFSYAADAATYSACDDLCKETALAMWELKCRRLDPWDHGLLQELLAGMKMNDGAKVPPGEPGKRDADDAMMQLLGCMQAASSTKKCDSCGFCHSVRLGVMSTLNKFWAVFRPDDKNVWISPEVNITTKGDNSVLMMLQYVLSEAIQWRRGDRTELKPLQFLSDASPGEDTSPPGDVEGAGAAEGAGGSGGGGAFGGDKPKGDKPMKPRGKGKASGTTKGAAAFSELAIHERENIDNFSTFPKTKMKQRVPGTGLALAKCLAPSQPLNLLAPLIPLGKQPDRETWLVQAAHDLAVVKCFLRVEERDMEVQRLMALSALQGRNVPELLAPSCSLPNVVKRPFGFMMSCVGGRPVHDYRPVKPLRVPAVMKLLDVAGEMHKLGVVHRDLQPRNVVVDKATGGIFVVDFGSAMLKGDFSDPTDFDIECQLEISEVLAQLETARKGDLA